MSVTTTLQAAPRLDELELVGFSVGDDPAAQGRLAVSISAATGPSSTVVYLEVDPGHHIPQHTHSAEEVFVVLGGEGIVTVGDEQWTASQGAVAVAPAFSRHGWENTSTETLRLAGYLDANVFTTEFDEPVAPFGVTSFVTPA